MLRCVRPMRKCPDCWPCIRVEYLRLPATATLQSSMRWSVKDDGKPLDVEPQEVISDKMDVEYLPNRPLSGMSIVRKLCLRMRSLHSGGSCALRVRAGRASRIIGGRSRVMPRAVEVVGLSGSDPFKDFYNPI